MELNAFDILNFFDSEVRRWLRSPTDKGLEKAFLAVAPVISSLFSQTDAFDSNRYGKLVNALGLLLLFDPTTQEMMERRLNKFDWFSIDGAGGENSALILERSFLGYLSELLKKNEDRKSPKKPVTEGRWNPRWNDLEFFWIKDIILAPEIHKQNELIVNLNSFEIEFQGHRTFSKPLSRSVALFSRKRSIHFSELLFVAFELPNFDSTIHKSKVMNLVSRLRIYLKIKTKNEIAYLIGSPKIHVIGICPYRSQIAPALRLLFPKKEQKRIPVKYSEAFLEKALPNEFTRKDLQRVLNFPRSTINRRLKYWVDRKIVKVIGRGRKTKYTFFSNLSSHKNS